MFSNFSFTKNLKKCLIASAAIIFVGIILLCTIGVKLDIGFTGGYLSSYTYTGDIDTKQVEAVVEEIIKKEASVSTGGSADGKVSYVNISIATNESIPTDQQDAITKALAEKFKDNKVEFATVKNVAANIGSQFFALTLGAVFFAAVLVVIYMALRFKKIGGASAAVIAFFALLHDVAMALLACVIFGLKIDSYFMSVALLLLGYSLNNTIVIYDRVRENKGKLHEDTPIAEIVNKSISETMMRSIVTTATTIIAVITIAIVSEFSGVTTMRSFAIPMAVGLLSGFYTSVFLAGPLWVKWREFASDKFTKSTKKSYAKKKR